MSTAFTQLFGTRLVDMIRCRLVQTEYLTKLQVFNWKLIQSTIKLIINITISSVYVY